MLRKKEHFVKVKAVTYDSLLLLPLWCSTNNGNENCMYTRLLVFIDMQLFVELTDLGGYIRRQLNVITESLINYEVISLASSNTDTATGMFADGECICCDSEEATSLAKP